MEANVFCLQMVRVCRGLRPKVRSEKSEGCKQITFDLHTNSSVFPFQILTFENAKSMFSEGFLNVLQSRPNVRIQKNKKITSASMQLM